MYSSVISKFFTEIETIIIKDGNNSKLTLSDELLKITISKVYKIIHLNNKYTAFYINFNSIFEEFYLNNWEWSSWKWNLEEHKKELLKIDSYKLILDMEYIESCQTNYDKVDLPFFQKYCYYVTKEIISEIIGIRLRCL